MGYYKTLAEWKTVLKQKGEKYCEMLMLEAQAQALLTKTTEAYIKLQEVRAKAENGDFNKWWRGKRGDNRAAQKAINEAQEEYENWKNNGERYRKKHLSSKKITTSISISTRPKTSSTRKRRLSRKRNPSRNGRKRSSSISRMRIAR